jgi:ElaB/YqjD/DUF883 family membrane-anchored ribosome-binding protein
MSGTNQIFGANGKLKRSFDEVIGAAEDLLRATADETSADCRKAHRALEANVRAAKSQISDHAEELVADARALGEKGNRLVHANAWAAVGIGAAVGVLAGMLLRRR